MNHKSNLKQAVHNLKKRGLRVIQHGPNQWEIGTYYMPFIVDDRELVQQGLRDSRPRYVKYIARLGRRRERAHVRGLIASLGAEAEVASDMRRKFGNI